MTAKVKIGLGIAAVVALLLYTRKRAAAAPASSATDTASGTHTGNCAPPYFPCSYDPTQCCHRCSSDPNCSVTPDPSQDSDYAPGTDGPITDPSQVSGQSQGAMGSGPITSPDQL